MRMLNKPEVVTKVVKQEEKYPDPRGLETCYCVVFRVAGMLGANGPYTVTVNTTKRMKEIESSPYFREWLTPMTQKTFWC